MNIVNKDSKNTFTRMCIGEAIIKLLKDTDFDKIRITSVAYEEHDVKKRKSRE